MIFSDIEVLFLKRLINIISSIILLILVLIIIVIFAPKLFSIEPMVIVSGSMEPSYMKGSLLYVKESAGGIQTGDVPVLGYPASFLGTTQGKFVFIVLLIIFTGITVLTDKKMEKTNG